MRSHKWQLKAALNGNRSPTEHPALPVTPVQLAYAGQAACAAGAFALHFHPRDELGRETLAPQAVGAALSAVRAQGLGVSVGISSGFWILPDIEAQLAAAQAWEVKPDFVSVNWHEPHAQALAQELLRLGIGVEAGIWTREAAHTFLTWPQREQVTRILIEMVGDETTVAEAHAILQVLQALRVPKLLHGEGENCWPMLREARHLGLLGRIGLEDTLSLPSGHKARDNAELVSAALRLEGS